MDDKKVNKVVYDGETLIDLTGDSVTPETLAKGETAHNASGEQIVGTMVQSDGGPYLPLKNNEKKAVSHYFEVKTGGDTSWIKIDTSLNEFVVNHSVEFLNNVNIQHGLHVSETLTAGHVTTDHCEVVMISSISDEPIMVNDGMKTMSLRPIEAGLSSIGQSSARYNTIYVKKVDATEHVITPKIRPPAVDGANYLRFITKDNVLPDTSPDPLPPEWGGTGQSTPLTAEDVGALPSSVRLGDLIYKEPWKGSANLTIEDTIGLVGKQTSLLQLTNFIKNLLNVVNIATGSWAGTNTYGSSNAMTLTIPFAPKVIWIYAVAMGSGNNSRIYAFNNESDATFIIPDAVTTAYKQTNSIRITGLSDCFIKKSADGKTIQFYSNDSSAGQFNANNCIYYWIAFG